MRNNLSEAEMSAIPSLTLFTNYYYYYGFSYVSMKKYTYFPVAALSMEALHIVSCCLAIYTGGKKAPFFYTFNLFLFSPFFIVRKKEVGKEKLLERL